jgi:uncharacterized protein DUF6079
MTLSTSPIRPTLRGPWARDDIVTQMRNAVSGQFISVNETNGQIYLDLAKDVDYEQLIEQWSTELDEPKLDAAYYKAVEPCSTSATTRTPHLGLRAAVACAQRHPTRLPVHGAPNERSTVAKDAAGTLGAGGRSHRRSYGSGAAPRLVRAVRPVLGLSAV